ncbi:hypothetical protein EON09_21160 [Pseudomonas soli]|uniref:Uncharacterized protein n=2 Tax=cellular organisms TaxID=131567 RepID=A0A2A2KJD7_9BILA|nr:MULTISPECIES: hypothetical protein [Pseudomonas]PAV73988.1 hypothetical protein WR25_26991 [Diploscapter pachys]AIN58255.1 hypothetical protein O165_008115 [Pseudomonas soli]AUY32302.1 hypothetical protein C3F42_03300 [Pseudomonas sp. PONIH3]MCX5506862.1 hypothetical protein [Pseudomonas sp. BJa3]MDT3712385.1 hypothetical protein [Pseudomonas soli]
MKKIVLVASLAAASLTQMAYGSQPAGSPKGTPALIQSSMAAKSLPVDAPFIGDMGSSACPGRTARTSTGDCQPPAEFD